jgi:hypothetical protein
MMPGMRAPLPFSNVLSGLVTGIALSALAAGDLRSAGLPPGLLDRYQRESGPWGTVYHRGWSRQDRTLLSTRIAGALDRVERRIGRRRGGPFTAILTRDGREFAQVYESIAGSRPPSWIAGAAFPSEDLLVVKGEAFPVLMVRGDRPDEVLEHELAHLVLHRKAGTKLPRWFDEGVAMWASGKVLDPDDEAFLSGLARICALGPFASLDREMPSSHDLATIAYLQSLLAVRWIAGRFGRSAIGDLLDRMEAGEPIESAVAARTGIPLSELEEEFRRWLAGRRSILEALASSVSLWTLVSLLAVLAILRYMVRRRRMLRKMEEAESVEEQ